MLHSLLRLLLLVGLLLRRPRCGLQRRGGSGRRRRPNQGRGMGVRTGRLVVALVLWA